MSTARERRVRTAIGSLLGDHPGFHGAGGEARWDVSASTLEAIATHTNEGAVTIETGCGASTVLFAAAGARHTVVTSDPEEFERVVEFCGEIDVPTDGLRLVEGSSDVALPGLSHEPIDVALIDGAHSFPFPVVDFHYMSRLLRTGGVLIVDDVFIPSVAVIHRFVTASDDWEQLQILDDQAAVYRMRTPPTPYDYWRIQGINKNFPDYSFLPVGRRIRLTAIARLSSVKWLKSIARRPGVRSVVQRLSR